MDMKELITKDAIALNGELSELLKAQFKLRMQKGLSNCKTQAN